MAIHAGTPPIHKPNAAPQRCPCLLKTNKNRYKNIGINTTSRAMLCYKSIIPKDLP